MKVELKIFESTEPVTGLPHSGRRLEVSHLQKLKTEGSLEGLEDSGTIERRVTVLEIGR